MVSEIIELVVKEAFPLKKSPLIQCITNEITCESMANALLYIDAKPVMADDPREFAEFFSQNDGLLLNLGHLSERRQANLLAASDYAVKTMTPMVIDLVGVSATSLRYELGYQLLERQPQIVKGNISEMRRFCNLNNNGRGVDSSALDQEENALAELAAHMKQLAEKYPTTTFMATGEKDLVVSKEQSAVLENGVPELDRFTGTGDIVGAIACALLGVGMEAMQASIAALSYFNLCGEQAKANARTQGLADFRHETMNQLSLLMVNKSWHRDVKGKFL